MINCMYILYYRDDYMSYLKPNNNNNTLFQTIVHMDNKKK